MSLIEMETHSITNYSNSDIVVSPNFFHCQYSNIVSQLRETLFLLWCVDGCLGKQKVSIPINLVFLFCSK